MPRLTMPELPEVEVLVRHLRPLLHRRRVRAVRVHRARVIAPTSVAQLQRTLRGARFTDLQRRGKYLLFHFTSSDAKPRRCFTVLGHLGMTGRMYLQTNRDSLPKHAAVVLDFGRQRFVYEDPRYFGRFTLDVTASARLGPEPNSSEFSSAYLLRALARSRQAIKIKLLDQSVVAGVGYIYASEALFRAGISPRTPARRLCAVQIRRLRHAVRTVLQEAIRFGSTLPLHHGPAGKADGLFYYGRASGATDYHEERLRVYDRAGEPCWHCQTPIRRFVQAARSTFYCPQCQPVHPLRQSPIPAGNKLGRARSVATRRLKAGR